MIDGIIKDGVYYRKDKNIFNFFAGNDSMPAWSKALEEHIKQNKTSLNMEQNYSAQRKRMAENEKLKQFADFVSSVDGVKADLASGPSGYFAPILDNLKEKDIFIATDASPSIAKAHAKACSRSNFFVFNLDLNRELPFKDESVDIFTGYLLNNVENYAGLIRETYRCLKRGGKLALIEMFFEHGCKTHEYLMKQGAIWSSYEVFEAFCESAGFKALGSGIIASRSGKIAEGDLLPLDNSDRSLDMAVYFEKP
ncbi:MAG: class I SAM-dependent methyltransferase [Christensenellales bacterium]|jgi:ubiquinone/menaquinone biosynthesis C-methylase UbiE